MPSDKPLPAGLYFGEVESMDQVTLSESGYRMRVVHIRWILESLDPTDRILLWLVLDHPNARWKWEGIVPWFDLLHEALGRVFLFKVALDSSPREYAPRNIVMEAMCELEGN